MKAFLVLFLLTVIPFGVASGATAIASRAYVTETTVDRTSDQKIAGVKTFDASPVVPTPPLPPVQE